MKKIFLLIITSITIFGIYFLTIDRKIYYLVLGDDISLGVTDTGKTDLNYTNYVKNYLQEQEILEKYVNSFAKEGYRITDIVNDVKNNKKVSVDGKYYTLKNALIKSDLVTISINNNDIIGRLNASAVTTDLYGWIDELSEEYEEMLKIIRDYCKEEIIVIGYYYPIKEETDVNFIRIVSYLNDSFHEVSNLYNIKYIDISELFMENNNLVGKNFPTEEGYKVIGQQIIAEFKDSKEK